MLIRDANVENLIWGSLILRRTEEQTTIISGRRSGWLKKILQGQEGRFDVRIYYLLANRYGFVCFSIVSVQNLFVMPRMVYFIITLTINGN